MKQLQLFIDKVTMVTKWALIGVAFVKALEVFNAELKKISIDEPKEETKE